MNYAPSEADVETKGVLTSLRLMRPARTLTRTEARRVAERQAAKLLRLRDALEPPIHEEVISHLPRVQVYRESLGSLSGLSFWDGSYWRISVNGHHANVRQRFTMAHELSHVLDAPYKRLVRADHAEEVADYFAASVLMPKRLVKRLWGEGVQDTPTLARRFGVSMAAMRWRLDELRLDSIADVPMPRRGRCGGLVSEAQLEGIFKYEESHEYPFAA
jgi:predicted transcriptional regulator